MNIALVLKAWEIHGKTMENSWGKSMDSLENHGAWSQNKIPWFSWGYFHAFHASMGQENCKNIPNMSMGIYKNEMGSMVFSSILLKIISRKHGKHRKAWNLCK